jgi:phage-related protein
VARGAVQSFDWTPPHGSEGKWVARDWTIQQTGPFTRTVQATFDEVFA